MSLTWNGNDPEPFAVDAVLEQMEWEAQRAEEKERTRKAIAYVNTNRKTVPMPRKAMWVGIICLSVAASLFLWIMGHLLTDWVGQIGDFLRSL